MRIKIFAALSSSGHVQVKKMLRGDARFFAGLSKT
jgi:hypothetical protein